MKHNPNTRNIFSAEGRLNRCIDKYNKKIKLLNKMNEAIRRLENKVNNMEIISIDEINKTCYPEEEKVEECVIRCDGCEYEFDIVNKDIERTITTEQGEDGEPYTAIHYICPKCGFSNDVEIDDDDEDIDSSDKNANEDIINESMANLENHTHEKEELCGCNKNININNKIKSFRFIQDEKIINAINIAIKHKSVSETISMLRDKDIELITSTKDSVTGYSTKTGDIIVAHEKDNKEELSVFTINTRLMLVPHGNYIKVYNSILNQLNIEKVDNRFESIKLCGKACIVKLHDDSLAACNFNINGNYLTMTIIYNIED